MKEKSILERSIDLYTKASACDVYFTLYLMNCQDDNLRNAGWWIADCLSEDRQNQLHDMCEDTKVPYTDYYLELQKEATQLFDDLRDICDQLLKNPKPLYEAQGVASMLVFSIMKMRVINSFIEDSKVVWGKYTEVVVNHYKCFNDVQINNMLFALLSMEMYDFADAIIKLLEDQKGFTIIKEEDVEPQEQGFLEYKLSAIDNGENGAPTFYTSLDLDDPFYDMLHSIKIILEDNKQLLVVSKYALC